MFLFQALGAEHLPVLTTLGPLPSQQSCHWRLRPPWRPHSHHPSVGTAPHCPKSSQFSVPKMCPKGLTPCPKTTTCQTQAKPTDAAPNALSSLLSAWSRASYRFQSSLPALGRGTTLGQGHQVKNAPMPKTRLWPAHSLVLWCSTDTSEVGQVSSPLTLPTPKQRIHLSPSTGNWGSVMFITSATVFKCFLKQGLITPLSPPPKVGHSPVI